VATLTVDGEGTTRASGATTDLANAAKIIFNRWPILSKPSCNSRASHNPRMA
jgi:hypothetical protein